MTENEILSQLGTILQQPSPLTLEAVFSDMPEWDSLAQISIVAFFKNKLQKPIPFSIVQNAKTPADLIDFFNS